jgi:hypothetical protein
MKQKLSVLYLLIGLVTSDSNSQTAFFIIAMNLTKMNNLEVKKENKNRYLSYAGNKSTRKVVVNFIYTHMSTTRNYYDEEIIDRTFHYISTW